MATKNVPREAERRMPEGRIRQARMRVAINLLRKIPGTRRALTGSGPG